MQIYLQLLECPISLISPISHGNSLIISPCDIGDIENKNFSLPHRVLGFCMTYFSLANLPLAITDLPPEAPRVTPRVSQ